MTSTPTPTPTPTVTPATPPAPCAPSAALVGLAAKVPVDPRAPAPTGASHHRSVRSFVLRTGRTTAGQARAFSDMGPQFLLAYGCAPLDFGTAFNRAAPTVLEIGFGMGEATAHIASAMPHINFLCCEVHTPGVGALLKRINEQALSNIRIVQHDAVEVIDHMLPAGELACLDGVHIFFPDPWHKKKHNKRRLIQAPLIAKLTARLKPGGYLHCATDWQPYAEQILSVLSAQPGLHNTARAGYATKPDYRPLTKFENRGIKLGHGVWDVVFERSEQAPGHAQPHAVAWPFKPASDLAQSQCPVTPEMTVCTRF